MSAQSARGRITWTGVTPYLFIMPAFAAMLFIVIVPAILGVLLSFSDFSAKNMGNWTTTRFIGLENYKFLMVSPSGLSHNFRYSVIASLKFTVFSLVLIYPLGLCAALALNKDNLFFKMLRVVFLIPWVIPNVVEIFMWKSFLLRDSGGFNDILLRLGLIREPLYWLLGGLSIASVLLVNVWRSWPFVFISLLAALQGIPAELLDAARVDGATKLQIFKYITFPALLPVSKILVLLNVIWSALNFNTPYVLFNQVPPVESNLLPLFAYNTSFTQWDFARGSAVSVCLMVVMMVLSAFYIKLVVENRKLEM